MIRKYDSSRRREAAEKTRRDILQAALRLHWEGDTRYESLAEAAGCSVATVRKYFPAKEELFRNCTRTFAESLRMPDLEALGALYDQLGAHVLRFLAGLRLGLPEADLEDAVNETFLRVHRSLESLAVDRQYDVIAGQRPGHLTRDGHRAT